MNKLPKVSDEPVGIKIDKRRQADRKIYAQELMRNNLNTKETMRKLSHEGITDKALSNKLNRWLSDPEVIREISKAYEELNITVKDTKNILSAVLFKTILKEDTKDSDRIQGCLAQAKIAGITQDSLNQVNVMLNNTSSDLSRILDGEIVEPTIDNTNNTTTNSDNDNV